MSTSFGVSQPNERSKRLLQFVVSVFGFGETLVACYLTYIACIRLQQWWYLVLASAVAPLLLLRTKLSTAITKRLLNQFLARHNLQPTIFVGEPISMPLGYGAQQLYTDPDHVWAPSVSNLVLGIQIFIVATWYRLLGILISLKRSFVRPLKAIPQNHRASWLHSVFLTPLEIVPGYGSFPLGRHPQESTYWFSDVEYPLSILRRFGAVVFLCLIVWAMAIEVAKYNPFFIGFSVLLVGVFVRYPRTLAVVPMLTIFALNQLVLAMTLTCSFAYRWSLKSTMLVWWPLIFLTAGAFDKRNMGVQLSLRRDSIPARFWLDIQKVIGLAIFTKYACLFCYKESMAVLASMLSDGQTQYVEPLRICVWQLATLLNVLLSFILLYRIDHELIARQHNTGHSDSSVAKMIGVVSYIKAFLTIYSLGCSVWLVGRLILKLPPLSVDWRILP